MVRPVIPVSLLYSSSGPYAALGRDAVDGALTAIAECNADDGMPFRIEPRLADPGGNASAYASLAESAVKSGCQHIIGTITSWSRKEVLPVVERHGALLWYAFPYEGYEASDHALYFGACPNQHLLPLFDHVLPRYGRNPFIVGSNYIWGWEISRIARELVEAAGGEILADRYLPLGSIEVEHLIAEISARKPDFILSNLVGESLHAFLAAYAALGARDPDFAQSRRPVVSCNASESDFVGLEQAAQGHITASVYFQALDTPENHAFKARTAARRGPSRRITAPYASVYAATPVFLKAVAEAGTADPATIRRMVSARQFMAPYGMLSIDARSHHAALRPLLGRSDGNGEFEIIASGSAPVPADPYLVGPSARAMFTPRTASGSDANAQTWSRQTADESRDFKTTPHDNVVRLLP